MHPFGQQALTKIEALPQGVSQGGIQNEVCAVLSLRLFAQCVDQFAAHAEAAGVAGRHQVIDVQETPIQPVLLNAIARSEQHTSELQSLMRIPYAATCYKQK